MRIYLALSKRAVGLSAIPKLAAQSRPWRRCRSNAVGLGLGTSDNGDNERNQEEEELQSKETCPRRNFRVKYRLVLTEREPDRARTAKSGSRDSASLVRASDLLEDWRKAVLLGAGISNCRPPVR